MSIVLGYTRQSDDAEVVINNYESPELAEAAIAAQSITDISCYWLASYVHPETNQPDIFAYIDL